MNFYMNAARALDHLDKYPGSVKGSLAAAGINSTPGEAKRLLALVIETLKYRSVLTQLLETVSVQQIEKLTFPRKTPFRQPTSQSLLQVLLHDLLFSAKRRIEASDKWPPKEAILRHQSRLRSELVRLQLKEGKSRKEDLGKSAGEEEGARYVRFNPNIDASRSDDFSLAALHEHLQTKHGFEKVQEPVFPVPDKKYFMDEHLAEVLVFPANTTWWTGDIWYESGAVILQDKASCFPAKVLMAGWEPSEGECLDATAAPGNKTSYISALMANKGTVHAFERSEGRYKTLEKMLGRAGCSNVLPRRADFLDSKPDDKEFSKVTRILLDPSCSGSGIVNRLDYLLAAEQDETDAKAERLEKLASFQLQMILHAFKFSSVRKIVYSTCSIHPEEDEHVVMKALASKEAKTKGWTLSPRDDVLGKWYRRGRPEEMNGDEELASSVIRCLPKDKTNGFFVACFERLDRSSKKRVMEVEADEPKPVAGKKSKTTQGTVVGNADAEADAETSEIPKTEAQLERARRKKQQQKAKKRTTAVAQD